MRLQYHTSKCNWTKYRQELKSSFSDWCFGCCKGGTWCHGWIFLGAVLGADLLTVGGILGATDQKDRLLLKAFIVQFSQEELHERRRRRDF